MLLHNRVVVKYVAEVERNLNIDFLTNINAESNLKISRLLYLLNGIMLKLK